MIARHLLLAALLAAGAGTAAAQPSSGLTAAQAEQLFKDGKRLMGEGRIAEACTAFEGSYRKDAAITTLLNLADCREKNKQLASAWSHFLAAERQTRNDPAQVAFNATAAKRAAALEPRLSYLIINVADESRIDGLLVYRDDDPVDPAEWNRKSPVDGGTYKITGKAPGHEPWSATATVGAERDVQSVDVPRFKALPDAPPDEGAEDRGPPPPPAGGMSGKRKAAIGLGAVGVAAGIGAVVLEVTARGIYSDSEAEPDDDKQQDLYDQANSRRLYAQIAGGVAVAAVGTAAVLWFTGKPSSGERAATITPILGSDRAGFAFTGRF